MSAADNPFCTRRVRPGAIPFLFPPGESVAGLVERLRAANGWGQVVGAHGTGKSTLLAALLPKLQRPGMAVVPVALHDGQRRLPRGTWQAVRNRDRALVVIDGYEQLTRWQHFRLKRWCRWRGHGLLVTAHDDVGLPDLCRTRVELSTACRVVEHLVSDRPRTVTGEDVARQLAKRSGNLREARFDLYDLHQRRCRSGW